MTTSMSGHWVIFSFFAWGHLRPVSNLAVALARKFPDITISFIVDASFASKSFGEIERNVKLGPDASVLSRIRHIPVGRAMAGMTPELAAKVATLDPRWVPCTSPAHSAELQAVFDAMMEERPFEDSMGKMWEPIDKPNFIVSDVMMGHVTPALKQKYGVPLYMWFVGSATSFTRSFGPTEKGGRAPGYIDECLAIEADPEKSKGRSFNEIAHGVWARSASFKDDVVRVKGLSPFYQWEDAPQTAWHPVLYDTLATGYLLMQATDGILLPSLVEIEREGVEGLIDWYAGGDDRKVLCLGPQLPPEYFFPTGSKKHAQLAGTEVRYNSPRATEPSSDQTDIDPSIAFLDDALDKYGVHSVIYVSFGSIFFPKARHVQILFERILALEQPMSFIFTTAAPNAFLSDELAKKIQDSGRGLVVPWAPQQAILAHAALGAFISHCGGGGTFESLSQGVPVIGWPFIGDQPAHALWMSEVLDTGFELLQVRDGLIKGNAFRGGPDGTAITGTDEAIAKEIDEVLKACQGEVGKRKRANAESVKQLIWDAHQPGGQIDQHLDLLKPFASKSN
ncbi:glycosyltransferase family 1 protein [Calocera viscosa TUFC12733]|uniref:Glycosyltransferase family 1 protein n=1 Tax=Calocera viscosa (strain TUFC12733) TaxID=1330018 RepID=A0A167PPP7_CALVF|nr:glycosyltransferase family 1 protein [Calocera viscosa TUFC12733]